MEEVVENLVKTWEYEASHKADLGQWKTIDHENYGIQTNGGPLVAGEKAAEIGNYNALMISSEIYQNCKLTGIGFLSLLLLLLLLLLL